MPAVGDLLASRYRILAPLGSGGMATVHRARDERLERDVAVKVLLPNLSSDPATASRFEGEARSLAAAAHPSVVAVYDVDAGDPANGREPFFVMELCAGGSLATRLTGGRRLAPDELVPILVSVADGLAELHRRGIVHRDVKPSNILFAADRAKLADFGLARPDEADGLSDLTAPGTAVGTLSYLAPEILAGERATAAADIYALGVVAFLGLTGEPPRRMGSMAELVAAAQVPARRPSVAAPWLGTSFDETIGAALFPDPAARPDALDVAGGLTLALGRWSRDGGPRRWSSEMAAGQAAAGSIAGATAATAAAADPVPSDEATTAAAVPLMQTARIPIGPTGRDRDRGRPADGPASSGSRWLQPAIWLSVLLLIVALLAPRLGALLAPGGSPSGPPPVIVSETPSPSASASPSTAPSPSPSIAPSPSRDPAFAALDAMDAAIAAAQGGPDGLKGKDAKDLATMTADVRQALTAGDRHAALDRARRLDKRISDLADKIGPDQESRLRSASTNLVRALGG
jgi:eukaryotic-like serine/threonine-protein kinase